VARPYDDPERMRRWIQPNLWTKARTLDLTARNTAMVARRARCPSCGASWETSSARYCGRCGDPLDLSGTDRRAETSRRGLRGGPAGRLLVVVAGGALLVVASIAARAGGYIELPMAQPDTDVELPAELGPPAELTPEQRESLERFDPDRMRCEPEGCEAWRLVLDHPVDLVAVNSGWLAALDGPILRVRALGPVRGEVDTEAAARHSDLVDADTGSSAHPIDPTGPRTDPDGVRFEFATADRVVGGSSWGSSPPSDDSDGAEEPDDRGQPSPDASTSEGYDLDLVGLFDLDVTETPPTQLAVLEDGSVVLLWSERLALIGADGTLRWELLADTRSFRYAEQVGPRLLVLRDDLAWPEGTTGPRPSPDPIVASVHDPHDGRELWRRYTLSPRDLVGEGLLITTVDGTIELVDLVDGTTRWRRTPGSGERVQTTPAPWLILASPGGSTLLDAGGGAEVATRDGSALLTPPQPIHDAWVAAWVDGVLGGGPTHEVTLLALGDDGRERWQVPLSGLGDGMCCPAAIPWVDGTVAVYDPGIPPGRWVVIDAATGKLASLPDDHRPTLPLPVEEADRVHVPPRGNGRLMQRTDDQVALLAADGRARVGGATELEVISVDPFVVAQGRELLGVRLVPER
jgi:hypothetical protein